MSSQVVCDASALVALLLGSYELLLPRAWELRHDLSSYDASYVSLAEFIQAPLITLDLRISRAPGLRCAVTTPWE